MWQDNESISMTRFQTKGANLILVDVELEDAGSYVCTATNGFGSQSAGIKLIVVGRSYIFADIIDYIFLQRQEWKLILYFLYYIFVGLFLKKNPCHSQV